MNEDTAQLRTQAIMAWGQELGFSAVSVGGASVAEDDRAALQRWLALGCHGDMAFMERPQRMMPTTLLSQTTRIISVLIPYEVDHPQLPTMRESLTHTDEAVISRYAMRRDYHTPVRQMLLQLARRMTAAWGAFPHRVCCDSAPVLEVSLAQRSGLGWRGKNTLLLHRRGGSWHFVGEMLVALDLALTSEVEEHCGRCTRCLDICPTQAFTAPYQLDARRCISYLTIEHRGSIPEPLRPLLGNRVFGCDDCQWICPWNKPWEQAPAKMPALALRPLERDLAILFLQEEAAFLSWATGTPLRRLGHERWLRNLAVALGNAHDARHVAVLEQRRDHPSALVREHVVWALRQHQERTRARQ